MGDVHEVLAALAALHSPTTPHATRLQAHQYCEAFKENVNCVMVSFGLLKEALVGDGRPTPEVLHFASHVLENAVKKFHHKVVEASTAEKAPFQDIRNELLAILSGGLTPQKLEILQSSEFFFAKSKLANVLSEIAKREVPTMWPEFFNQMLALWKSGDYQAEIALQILSMVAEDCYAADFNLDMPAGRRKQIMMELNSFMPQYIQLLVEFVGGNLERMNQSQGNPASQRTASQLICASMDALVHAIQLTPVAGLKDAHVVDMFSHLANVKDKHVQKTVCATLCHLLRKVELATFTDELMVMFQAVITMASSSYNWDGNASTDDIICCTDLHKILCDALSVLAAYHFNALIECAYPPLPKKKNNNSNKKGGKQPKGPSQQQQQIANARAATSHPVLISFLEVLCAFLGHPNYKIVESVGSVWFSILQHTELLNVGVTRDPSLTKTVLTRLMPILAKKVIKIGFPEEEGDQAQTRCCLLESTESRTAEQQTECLFALSHHEFQDDKEFHVCLMQIRSITALCWKCLADAVPGVCVRYLEHFMNTFVREKRFLSEGQDSLNEKRQCTIKTSAFLGIDALCFTLESVFMRLPLQLFDAVQVQKQGQGKGGKGKGGGGKGQSATVPEEVNITCRMLQTILEHQPSNDPVLLAKFAQMIPAFFGLFKARLDVFPSLAEQISNAFNECVKRLLNCSETTSDTATKEGNFILAQSLHADVLFARRRAGSSLVALSKTVSQRMMGILPQLNTYVMELEQRGALTSMEWLLYNETFVLLSNKLENKGEAVNFVRGLLEPKLQILQEEVFSNIISNEPLGLISTCLSVAKLGKEGMASTFNGIRLNLFQIFTIVKRITHDPKDGGDAMSTFLSELWWNVLLPRLLPLLSVLHKLWQPDLPNTIKSMAPQLPPPDQELLALVFKELLSMPKMEINVHPSPPSLLPSPFFTPSLHIL
jgi:hypothetical protein